MRLTGTILAIFVCGQPSFGCQGTPSSNQSKSGTTPLRVPLAVRGSSDKVWNTEANLFTKLPGYSITASQVDEKILTAWLRFSGQNVDADKTSRVIKLDAGDSTMAYADVNVKTPDNSWDGGPRACTEGQGWAMMIAAQMNDRQMFDKLWKFTKKYMQIRSFRPAAKRGYYFAWQVLPQKGGGAKLKMENDGPAPDGESWISAALCVAACRWKQTEYQTEANHILETMLHIDEWNGYKKDSTRNYVGQTDIVNMIQDDQICYIPAQYEMGPQKVSSHLISDPSYCLPAFYDLYAKVGPTADRDSWKRIAKHAREVYLPKALGQSDDSKNDDKKTGISPYVTLLDGSQYDAVGPESGHITSGDGLRTPSNVGLDYLWWSDGSPSFKFHQKFGDTFLKFLSDPTVSNPGMRISEFSKGGGWPYDYNRFWYGVYYTDGRDWVIKNSKSQGNNSSNHNEASSGMNAVAAHSANHAVRWKFVEELWGCHQPCTSVGGKQATYGDPYWDGTLYLLGLLETAGKFRPWIPAIKS